MKSIFKDVINRGNYDLSDLLRKIDVYHVEGKLTDEERDELYLEARNKANPENGVNYYAKLAELDGKVAEMERRLSVLESNDVEDNDVKDYPEYVVGKWYRTGDRASFEGENFVCSAPGGVVCTWSPKEYPPYWTPVTEG
jgi:hypothetical protein